jgi:hypothetical protein
VSGHYPPTRITMSGRGDPLAGGATRGRGASRRRPGSGRRVRRARPAAGFGRLAWQVRLAGSLGRGLELWSLDGRAQVSALILPASWKSAAVRPPAEWVDRVSVTRFHWIVMSGW